jgi:hypothetical protein
MFLFPSVVQQNWGCKICRLAKAWVGLPDFLDFNQWMERGGLSQQTWNFGE